MVRGTQCVAFGCNNRREKSSDSSKITFHRFPMDEELKEEWVQAISRENWKPSESSRICSVHFTEDCFDRSSPFVTKLKAGSVPSVFPGLPPHLQQRVKEIQALKKQKQSEDNVVPIKVPCIEPPENKELEKVKLRLLTTKKKLRNANLKIKRMKKRVALLENIVKDLRQKDLVQDDYSTVLGNMSKGHFLCTPAPP